MGFVGPFAGLAEFFRSFVLGDRLGNSIQFFKRTASADVNGRIVRLLIEGLLVSRQRRPVIPLVTEPIIANVHVVGGVERSVQCLVAFFRGGIA